MFKEWKYWFKQKPAHLKAIVLIILLKPLFDTFYDVTFFGISITILQAIGILIPILIIVTFLIKPRLPIIDDKITLFFFTWALLYLINAFLLIINNFNVIQIGLMLKYLLPIYIFAYYLAFLRSIEDTEKILYTFALSFIPLSIIFIFNLLSGNVQHTRGLVRIETSYGDIASIGISLNLTLAIILFFWLKYSCNKKRRKSLLLTIALVFLIGIVMLISISHGSSWIIFVSIIAIFSFYKLRKGFLSLAIFVALLFIPAYLLFSNEINTSFEKLYESDMRVYEGELDTHYAFHGRAGRWERHLDIFNRKDILDNLVGLVTITHPAFFGHGPHNDYLRILYSSGYIGLAFYALFIFSIIFSARNIPYIYKFLIFSVLAILLLQSVTLTPTIYHSVNFVFFAVVVMVKRIYSNQHSFALKKVKAYNLPGIEKS